MWLGQWLPLAPSSRDGRGTPFSGMAEQVDAHVRAVLGRHGLEEVLADDARAAFVAFTVGLAFRDIAREAALQAERTQKSPGSLVQAALTAALQRLAWRAAQHYAPAYPQAEPFGISVPPEALPPLTTTEETTK